MELVRAYVEGANSADLAERYGIHNDTVRAHLKRNGVAPRKGRPYKLTEEEVRWAADEGSAIHVLRTALELGFENELTPDHDDETTEDGAPDRTQGDVKESSFDTATPD